eukprot:UN28075
MIDRVKFKLDDPMDNVIRNMLDILSSIDLDDVIEDILIEPSEPPKKKRKLETCNGQNFRTPFLIFEFESVGRSF